VYGIAISRFPGNINQGGEDYAMEEPTNDAAPQEEATEETLGRRQLLKVLAATGGAAAASSLLPGKWAKPVVEAGVLPAHAQVSPTPQPTEQPTEEPLRYSIFCDSTPGGGDITVPQYNGTITNITAEIILVSGTGPIANIGVTMTAEAVAPSPLPGFSPSVPQTGTTNASGLASFGNLTPTINPDVDQSFNLRFSFADPINSILYSVVCGKYDVPRPQ
jgi:hypothetical protein